MVPCDHFQTLLWEDQFGLLEASVREGLRQHLAACSDCQSEQVKAETGYLRLARASRLEVVVPLLKAPDPDFVPVILAREPVRLARRWQAWPWVAAAAAALLLIGVPCGIFYKEGLARREAAYQAAERAVEEIIAQRDQARVQAEKEASALVANHQAKHLYVQVLGPAAYQPDNQNQYRILTSNMAGKAADVRVSARIVEPSGRIVGEAQEVGGTGEVLLTLLPRAHVQPVKAARLEVEARGLDQEVKLQAQIPILEPSYVTQLGLDKRIYRPGERVWFRSVTLKRFDLKPPEQSFKVTYTLQGPDAVVMASQSGQTRTKDGIGSWVFSLPKDCPDGEYTLTVDEAEKRFSTMTRQFQVQLRPPQDQMPAAGANHQLYVDFFPEGGDLVDFPCRVYFHAHDGRGQPVDLAGMLVDRNGKEVGTLRTSGRDGQQGLGRGLGVFTIRPHDLYQLRITSPAGITAAVDLPVRLGRDPGAKPIISSQLAVAANHPRKVVHTNATQGNQPLDIVLQELCISPTGLSVPTGVTRADEPLHITIMSQDDHGRPMVLGVFCRGRLVGEQAVFAKLGRTEIQLMPAVDAEGVLRVTLFDAGGDQLKPVAERLVYRRQGKRLNLSLEAEKSHYNPGEHVRLLIRSTNEQGSPEPVWLLSSVVSQAAFGPANSAGQDLPAYFHLGTELEQAADLENADFLASDDPQAAEALDLFLGTHGWRRFVEPDRNEVLAQNEAVRSKPAKGSGAGLLRFDNLGDVGPKYSSEVSKGLATLRNARDLRSGELTAEGEQRCLDARAATVELYSYRARPAEYARMGIGSLTLATLATGCVLLSFAAVRLARRRTANRRYLAGAFTALLFCLFTYSARTLGTASPTSELDQVELLKTSLRDRGQEGGWLDTEGPRFPNWQMAALESMERPVEQATHLVSRLDRSSIPQIAKGEPSDFKPAPPILYAPRAEGPGALLVREYAYDLKKVRAGVKPAVPDTILWKPVLISAADGTAQVEFDLPKNAATYRIRVEGHTSSGRLGSLQRVLEVRQNDVNPAK